jgi:hypothetical protein
LEKNQLEENAKQILEDLRRTEAKKSQVKDQHKSVTLDNLEKKLEDEAIVAETDVLSASAPQLTVTPIPAQPTVVNQLTPAPVQTVDLIQW